VGNFKETGAIGISGNFSFVLFKNLHQFLFRFTQLLLGVDSSVNGKKGI